MAIGTGNELIVSVPEINVATTCTGPAFVPLFRVVVTKPFPSVKPEVGVSDSPPPGPESVKVTVVGRYLSNATPAESRNR